MPLTEPRATPNRRAWPALPHPDREDRMPTVARRPLPLLTPDQIAGLRPDLADVIEYRKSGLSLNHVVGCPLECAYCVRHLYANFDMKLPRLVMPDEDAVQALVGHQYFRPHRTPLQLFNKATDPMLPIVKQHTHRTLQLLDGMGLTNHMLLITRWRVTGEDCALFNALTNLKLTVLVTHSNIAHPGIEPVDSRIAQASLRTLYERADRYRVILYWRPIVPGLNDSDADIALARDLSAHAHATVYTGLFYRDEIAAYYRETGLPEPYDDTARRKIMPEQLEARILEGFRGPDTSEPYGPLFRKTSCAVGFVHRMADYNGHYGIRELCDICPEIQLGRCAKAWHAPNADRVTAEARNLGAVGPVEITDRAVLVSGLAEHPRYYLQHGYGYQVHAREHPHNHRRHGRAETGWQPKESE
jgi:DNA repair photolyase